MRTAGENFEERREIMYSFLQIPPHFISAVVKNFCAAPPYFSE
jgi:hypothetical protein